MTFSKIMKCLHHCASTKTRWQTEVGIFVILLCAMMDFVWSQGEQWSIVKWWPAMLCLVMMGLRCLQGNLKIDNSFALIMGVVLLVWCQACDVVNGVFSPTVLVMHLSYLGYFVMVYHSNFSPRHMIGVVSLLTLLVAVWKIGSLYFDRIGALFDNPAGYAASLVLGLPCWWHLCCKTNSNKCWLWQRWGSRGALCLVIAALLLTNSRSGVFALFAMVGAACWLSFRPKRSIRFRKILLCVMLGVAVTLLLGLYSVRPASANGRLFIYRVAAGCVIDSPLMGYGTDGERRVYPMAQADFFTHHPGHPAGRLAGNVPFLFNEGLTLAFRYGLPACLWVVVVLWSLQRTHRHRHTSGTYVLWLPCIGLLILSLFSYPLEYAYIRWLLLTILALAARDEARPKVRSSYPSFPGWKSGILMGGIWIFCMTTIIRDVKGRRLWADGADRIDEGRTEAAMQRYAEAAEYLKHDARFLYNHAAELNLSGRYAESDSVLQHCFRRLYDYDCALLAADNALARERYAEAKHRLTHARHMLPSRLYPLYGFLMMYEATGQDALMRKTAESILQMQVKTPSAEAEMIKEEAREVLK